jgi:hypothetical protein
MADGYFGELTAIIRVLGPDRPSVTDVAEFEPLVKFGSLVFLVWYVGSGVSLGVN